ncbi:MAG: cobalamin synthesis protein P47K [Prevotellaceae bacterium]|jgi:Ni2+-binding GTPase involved in maturation of urease and hydrogenase|nr:cobalamin synthesis protein P47K [Prevotellaceae bacterium]
MATTKLMIVGGFLGAGKTTFLWQAAQTMIGQGRRVGLITNDQAPELVDSRLLSLNNLRVEEVSGSCFCCNFNGFTAAIRKMCEAAGADVIIAEPVGSCTDLSATIMQPLKQYWNRQLETAPLSVLADPVRLAAILAGETSGLHPDAAYIYRKQLEEADLIVINKVDLLSSEQIETLKAATAKTFPSARVMTVSARTGEGLSEWIEAVMQTQAAGQRIVEMDYDIYANGEAVLGWLNGTVLLRGKRTDWDELTRTLLNRLAARFDADGLPVGHVKVIAESDGSYVVGNLTGTVDTLSVRHSAGTSDVARIIVNARVETSPENLDAIVRDAINALCGDGYEQEVVAWRYLQPGRPNPTHRFAQVV